MTQETKNINISLSYRPLGKCYMAGFLYTFGGSVGIGAAILCGKAIKFLIDYLGA